MKEEALNHIEREDIITHLGEKMNLKLATRIFGKFDPIHNKMAECWSLNAQIDEKLSLLEDEMN